MGYICKSPFKLLFDINLDYLSKWVLNSGYFVWLPSRFLWGEFLYLLTDKGSEGAFNWSFGAWHVG